MKEPNIDLLLERYFEGETSIQEERLLREYFSTNNAASAERHLFQDLSAFADEKISREFEETILPQLTEINKRTPWPWRTILSAAATLLLGAILIFMYSRKTNLRDGIEISTTDKPTVVALSDGSTVTLNANTVVRYSGDMKKDRWVYLEGEAFFEVAKDAEHPFIISTGDTKTEVVGTSFDINSTHAELTSIMVVSGVVRFASNGERDTETVTLSAGHAALLDNGKIPKLIPFEANTIAWKTHRLEFKDTPLSHVLAALEDYYKIKTNVITGKIANCRFKGSFEDATLETVFDVLRFSLNIDVVKEGDVYTISGNGCKE